MQSQDKSPPFSLKSRAEFLLVSVSDGAWSCSLLPGDGNKDFILETRLN